MLAVFERLALRNVYQLLLSVATANLSTLLNEIVGPVDRINLKCVLQRHVGPVHALPFDWRGRRLLLDILDAWLQSLGILGAVEILEHLAHAFCGSPHSSDLSTP